MRCGGRRRGELDYRRDSAIVSRNHTRSAAFAERKEGKMTSAWFKDDAPQQLLEESVLIAADFLERTGEIDDPVQTGEFLVSKI